MATTIKLLWFKYKKQAERKAQQLHPDDKFPDRWVMKTKNTRGQWGYGVILSK